MVQVQYHPLSWTQLKPLSEAVEQFLAMLRFEHKSEAKKLRPSFSKTEGRGQHPKKTATNPNYKGTADAVPLF